MHAQFCDNRKTPSHSSIITLTQTHKHIYYIYVSYLCACFVLQVLI